MEKMLYKAVLNYRIKGDDKEESVQVYYVVAIGGESAAQLAKDRNVEELKETGVKLEDIEYNRFNTVEEVSNVDIC